MGFLIELCMQVLTAIYIFVQDFGLAIIIFSILTRSILLPLTIPSLRASQKIKELQPELKKIAQKYSDKKKQQLAQMELYKKYNVNPLAGCLPQIVQIGVLIILYQALTRFLVQTEINGVPIETTFFWLNLSKPDPYFILPILAGVTQLILSLMIAPGAETADIVPNNSTKKDVKKANEKEENVAEMAQQMQQQMLFLMPIMTGVIALNFPSGMALYWVVTTVYSVVTQYLISGPGGLVLYWNRLKARVQQ